MGGYRSLSELPEQFGKYSILGHLATGGMAEVYIARQAGLQGFEKIVVIKRVRPELLGDAATIGSFLDEARLVATLEHPNIAQVYEIGLVNDSYFFVMEYMHGADLRQLLNRAVETKHTISLADTLYTINGVCAALHYAHEKRSLEGNPLNIIHRDISPSNVLISHEGAVKVCDFGIAKTTARTHDTMQGVLKGKYSYMSPEQCRAETLDRRSDIFSIGILLYEMSTMSQAFKGSTDLEIVRTITEKQVPPPSTRVKDYPAGLEAIVMRALEKDPSRRYQTAQAMQLELEEFAREHKLGLSSVNISKLMAGLFERRALSDLLKEQGRRSGDIPTFVPGGSTDPEIQFGHEEETKQLTPTPTPSRRSQPIAVVSDPEASSTPFPLVTPRRWPSPLWLVGCLLAGGTAVGVTVAGHTIQANAKSEVATALENDADRVVQTLDATARSAHLRADSVATTPMLRTAIETDAATMRDLAEQEYTFSVSKTEVLEVFQVSGNVSTSMLRVPATARPIAVITGVATRLEVAGDHLDLVASAPISSHTAHVGGTLALRVTVELEQVKRALAKHTTAAELSGLGHDLPLFGTLDRRDQIRIPVPTSGDLGASSLVLNVAPTIAVAPTWIGPARLAGFGVGGLFLLVYLGGLVRVMRTRDSVTPATS